MSVNGGFLVVPANRRRGPDRIRSLAAALRPHLAVLLLLAAYLIVCLVTFRDYGITFDEEWQANYGEKIIAWFQTGFRDTQVFEYRNMEYYGGLFDVAAEAVWRFSPFGQFETRHLVNALVGVLGVGFAYLLGLRLMGRLAGFLAALFLVLTPFYYGHAFNNPKDIPFAVAYLAALWAIVRAVPSFPAPSWSHVALLGLTIGAALGVRIGGVLLLGYLALAFVFWAIVWLRPAEWWAAIRSFAPRLLAIGGIAYAIMLVAWPAALVDPLRHPLRTLRVMGSFDWNYLVRWEGRDVLADDLPVYFIEKYALLTLPEFVLLGLTVAAVACVLAFVRGRVRRNDHHLIGYAVVLFAIVFPLAYADLTDATVYDAQRHFLFVFPPLIVLAGIGIATALRGPRLAAIATGVAVVAGIGLTMNEMVRLHPHQYIYFNHAFAGGLARAHPDYETDYWGNALKEGAEWVAANLDTRALPRPFRIASCGHRMSTMYFLPDSSFQHVSRSNGKPDLFLGSKRSGCDAEVRGEVVHTIERRGAPLVIIKEVTAYARSRRYPSSP